MTRFSERGNAVVIILVAIALFGALAYTFMRGAKSGQGNLTAGQTKLAAQDILNYAQTVERGVQKLRSKGCSEDQLSFQNSNDTEHNFPSAPAECRLFDSAGANLTAYVAPSNWFTSSVGENQFYYTQGDPIQDVGTTCTDASCTELNLNLWNITQPLCEALNKELGLSFATIPTGELWGCPVTDGKFDCGGETPEIKFTDPDLAGKRAVCYNDVNFSYTFNYVLIER